MPTNDKRQLRTRKKEHTRNTIIKEATKLFNDKSYDDVLLEDIAEAAFLSRQTLYNYFKNKEEVHYAVGNQIYREENEKVAEIIDSNLAGKEQLIKLCERKFRNSVEKPILLKIIREYWNNFSNRGASSAKVYAEISETIGEETMNELVDGAENLDEFDFEKYFDEPNAVEQYLQFIKHGNLWVKAIQKGKQDNSIKIDLPDMQIMQFLNIVSDGTIHEVMRRQTALDRINMTQDVFSTNVIKLLSHFLDNYQE